MSDLIEREQALSAFDTDDNKLIIRGSENADAVEQYLKRVMDKIENLPSAQLGTNLAEVGTDLISRAAAIDALRDWEMCYDWDEHCREEPKEPWVVSPSDVVNKLPPIQPKRGKWLPDNNNYIYEQYVCSECKNSFKVDTCMGKPMWNFCPNCGADMRGEEDG